LIVNDNNPLDVAVVSYNRISTVGGGGLSTTLNYSNSFAVTDDGCFLFGPNSFGPNVARVEFYGTRAGKQKYLNLKPNNLPSDISVFGRATGTTITLAGLVTALPIGLSNLQINTITMQNFQDIGEFGPATGNNNWLTPLTAVSPTLMLLLVNLSITLTAPNNATVKYVTLLVQGSNSAMSSIATFVPNQVESQTVAVSGHITVDSTTPLVASLVANEAGIAISSAYYGITFLRYTNAN